MARSNFASDSGSNPSLVMSRRRFSLSSNRMTIFSPYSVGIVETRKSRSLILPSLRYLIMMRPSCGSRFSLMSSLAMILMRLVMASRSFIGGDHHRLQDSVNPEAHAHFFFVRLDVNVAGAPLDGVGQDQVHQLDDGRFLGRAFQLGEVHLLFFGGEFQVRGFLAGEVLHHLGEFFFALRLAVELGDGFGDGGLRGHHRLDVEAGHELDVVHREDVGGIGHRDGQRRADARKRNDLVADRGILRDQLDDGGIHFVILQIDGGNAVLAGKHTRNLIIADEAELHQTRPQPAAARLLMFQGLPELVGRDQVFLDQYFA